MNQNYRLIIALSGFSLYIPTIAEVLAVHVDKKHSLMAADQLNSPKACQHKIALHITLYLNKI